MVFRASDATGIRATIRSRFAVGAYLCKRGWKFVRVSRDISQETAYRDKPCRRADYGFHRATPCRQHRLELAVP